MKSLRPILFFSFLSLCCLLTGVIFQPGEWYANLNKPSWTPPNWVFGPLWTTLHILILISAWLMWKKIKNLKARIMTPYYIQIILNGLWTPVFFGAHEMFLGSVIILSLLGSILWTIISFLSISKTSGILLIPYFLWVLYASALCVTLSLINL